MRRLAVLLVLVLGFAGCGRSDSGGSPSSPTATTTPSCSFTVSPTTAKYPATGGTGMITITTASNCSWTATANVPWLQFTAAPGGTGYASLPYHLDSSPSNTPRVATLTVAGVSVSIAQGEPPVIVDTGIPTNTGVSFSFHGNTISELWWAGRFTLDQSYSLTDISYYLTPLYPGTVTVAIYAGTGVPVVGTELFKETFRGASSGSTNWYGISGISWTLSPGTYWLAFEARGKDNYYSVLPSEVPFPMEAVAAYRPWQGGYVLETPEGFGVRVSGKGVSK